MLEHGICDVGRTSFKYRVPVQDLKRSARRRADRIEARLRSAAGIQELTGGAFNVETSERMGTSVSGLQQATDQWCSQRVGGIPSGAGGENSVEV